MNRRLLIALCTTAVLGAAPAAFPQTTGNHLTVPFSDPARPGSVRVSLFSGSISVTVGTGREVVIDSKDDRDGRDTARRTDRGRSDSSVDGLHRLTQPAGVVVEEQNNVVNVSSSVMSGRVKLEVQVPAATSLVIRTVNGGEVAVDGVTGSTEVNSVNGSIRLTNLGGAVIAHATNGKVVATLRQVVSGTPMSFTSFNGDVDVTLPASAKATLKLRSDRGDVYTDFDVKTTAVPPTVVRQQRGPNRDRDRADGKDKDNDKEKNKDKDKNKDMTTIELDRAVYGTINGGGPDFELRTFNGNVMLRKAR